MSHSSSISKELSPSHSKTDASNRAQLLSKLWFSLSIGALLLAGFLSLSFIIGRAPVISEWITDPLWIKRVLIVHVNLALVIFIYAFFCGLFLLIPHKTTQFRLQYIGLFLAALATLTLIATIFIPTATPILSNYIPVLDHPLFIASLLLFAIGLIVTISNARLFANQKNWAENIPQIIPKIAIPALQSAALLLIISVITFVISWIYTDTNLVSFIYYERVIWGGGHILQFVNSAITVATWLIISDKLLGEAPMSYKHSSLLFVIFTIPVLFAPFLIVDGTSSVLYLFGFTSYMRWGIFPVVSIFMIVIIRKLIQAKIKNTLPEQPFKNPYFTGLVVSLTFMLIGFILGSLIRGSNTLIPAHYHATLGGITVAFITITYFLLDAFGKPFPSAKVKKWAAYQPLIFGLGQLLFVFGFAYAGSYGLARKAFGVEQTIGSTEALVGLAVAGFGGLLAIVGGFIFLWVLLLSIIKAPNL